MAAGIAHVRNQPVETTASLAFAHGLGGRGGEAITAVGIARIASGPFLQLGPGARSLKKRRPPPRADEVIE